MNDFLMGLLLGKRGGSGGGGGDAHGIPSGGTTGQVLAKTSNTDYSAGWTTPRTVPTGGVSGQILTRYGATYEWRDLSIPTDALIQSMWLDEVDGRTRIHAFNDLTYLFHCGKKLRIYDSLTESTIMYLIAADDYYDSVQDETESWAYFLDVSDPNVFPHIRYFKKEYDEDWGDDLYYEQTPPTHAVTGAWVGTAQEYAALSPNYDANTIYYIKG